MTQPTYFVEEDKILSALFDEGLDILHVNKPELDLVYAERLLSLLPQRILDRIVVHQHYFLKKEFDLRGIHIDRPEEPVPDGMRRHVTRSTPNIDDLKAMKKECDYVMLHSLYDSLHDGAKASLTEDEMRAARKAGLIDKHVYALGGMSLENIAKAKELGFGGVVICGDLWSRFSIQHEVDFKGLIEHFKKLRKAVG
jgi:thiamine-phosphate pyrophosphorylase